MGSSGLCKKKKLTVEVIIIKGNIGTTVTFKKVESLTNKAFSMKSLRAVCLVVDSWGGSPTQSELIARYLAARSRRTGAQRSGAYCNRLSW